MSADGEMSRHHGQALAAIAAAAGLGGPLSSSGNGTNSSGMPTPPWGMDGGNPMVFAQMLGLSPLAMLNAAAAAAQMNGEAGSGADNGVTNSRLPMDPTSFWMPRWSCPMC